MSRVKRIAIVVLIAFTGIQFVRPDRNESGEAVRPDTSNMPAIPDSVHYLLAKACFDCHSDNTSYPWYSNIQPVGWLLERDIKNGRAMLNFSALGSLSPRRQISKLRDAENRIKDGTMPLWTYQLMHPSARLSDGERQVLVGWIQTTLDTIAAAR